MSRLRRIALYAEKWIQKAIKRPGRMTRECRKRGYESATCECMREIAKTTKSRSLRSAAYLGLRLKKCSY